MCGVTPRMHQRRARIREDRLGSPVGYVFSVKGLIQEGLRVPV